MTSHLRGKRKLVTIPVESLSILIYQTLPIVVVIILITQNTSGEIFFFVRINEGIEADVVH